MDVQQRVRSFLIENFRLDPSELGDDMPLASRGFIDSIGMLEVVTFLESEFGIRIADLETTPDNLGSVQRMAAFVGRKRRSAA